MDSPQAGQALLEGVDLDHSRIIIRVNDEDVDLDPNRVNLVKAMLKGEAHMNSTPVSTLKKNPDDFHEVTMTGFQGPMVGSKAFDYNHFTTKKTVGMGLLLVSLIAINATQLKAVLQTKAHNEFAGTVIFFIVVSLLIQIACGIMLLLVGKSNLNTRNASKVKRIDFLNNLAVGLILLITILSVIVASFGLVNNPKYLIDQRLLKAALSNPNVTYNMLMA